MTRVIVAIKVYVVRVAVGGRCRVRKMNKRLRVSKFGRQGRDVIGPKTCSRSAKRRRRLRCSELLLWQTDTLVGRHRDATVRPYMTRVIAPFDPRFSEQVVDMHII